jgi:hypothetical protein
VIASLLPNPTPPRYTEARNGNRMTIPAEHLPKDYQAPGLRILPLGNLQGNPGPGSGR